MRAEKAPSVALGKKATAGVAWSFLREGVAEVLVFPASMVLARMLTPEEFGIAAAANFFTMLAARLSELGFNAAIVRSKEVKPIHLSTVFAVNLAMGGLTCLALSLAAPLVSAFYGIPGTGDVLRVAAIAFLIGPFGAVPSALLTRNLQYQKSTIVDWAQLVAFSLSSIAFAWMGFGYTSMVYGRIAAHTTQTVLRIHFARWRPSLRFSWTALKEILSFGAGVHAKRLLDYAAQQGDNVMVGKLLGMSALGLYDKAFSTMNRFLVRMNAGGPGVMFRIFAVINEEPDRFRRAYQKVIMSTSLVGFPVFAALMVAAEDFMEVLFGQQWLASASPFRLLCVAGALKLLNTYASSAIQATGRVWSEVWRQVALIVLMVVGIFMFRSWGPSGAAAAVLFATVVMTVLMHSLLHSATKLSWWQMMEPLLPGSCCAAGVAALSFVVGGAVRSFDPEPLPVMTLACQGLATGVFMGMFALFAPFAEMRAVVRDVTKSLAPDLIKRQAWARAYWEGPTQRS